MKSSSSIAPPSSILFPLVCPMLLLLLLSYHPTAVVAFHYRAATSKSLGPQRRGWLSGGTGRILPPLKESTVDDAGNTKEFEREFQQKQKALSEKMKSELLIESTTALGSREEHAEHQAKVFDELATFFDSEDAIPPDVVPVLQKMTSDMITQMIRLRNDATSGAFLEARPARKSDNATAYEPGVYHVLDVGCGTGALFDFYLEAAEANDITLHVHGLDLSANMVEKATAHGKELLEKLANSNKAHSISVRMGDICAPDDEEPPLYYYDSVVSNACFGNFWNQTQALEGMSHNLRPDSGMLCITHPLGSEFVRQLHEQDSKMVPHLLPADAPNFRQLTRTLPLQVLEVVDKKTDDAVSYYRATATKAAFRTLGETMRLRGTVADGYGRGGKKLGFPTANLPSGLFQNALQDVQCGVYFGWALLEGTMKGRNVIHKAVVNVGYSPTFEGQENPEKIVEAHLIFPKEDTTEEEDGQKTVDSPLDPPDFYGEVMRLQLIGFIRPEMKFPSFPALIARITTDVQDAKDALDLDVYTAFRKDLFFSNNDDKTWIGGGGGGGGDEAASWEFENVENVLSAL